MVELLDGLFEAGNAGVELQQPLLYRCGGIVGLCLRLLCRVIYVLDLFIEVRDEVIELLELQMRLRGVCNGHCGL